MENVITKEEAQSIYRRAWTDWAVAQSREQKALHETVMDEVQPKCCNSGKPDQEWRDFTATLPGYQQYWNNVALKEILNI